MPPVDLEAPVSIIGLRSYRRLSDPIIENTFCSDYEPGCVCPLDGTVFASYCDNSVVANLFHSIRMLNTLFIACPLSYAIESTTNRTMFCASARWDISEGNIFWLRLYSGLNFRR